MTWANTSTMKKLISLEQLKKMGPHFLIVLGFALAALIFYAPLLEGKVLMQSDIQQYEGMARQLKAERAATGEEIYWIDNAFGGMPTYQLGARYPVDFLSPFYKLIRILPRPAHILFLYFFSAYLLLLVLRIPWHTALIGSFAYGFSTYSLIILQVGHNTKALAIAYIPLVIAGVVLLFQQRSKLWGLALTTLALGLHIRANHYQMTYYLLLLMGVFVLVYAFSAYKTQQFKSYFKALGILTLAAILALGFNATALLATAEYSEFSTRSKTELKLLPDGNPREQSTGLDYDYITTYSYGIFESLNLIAPRIQGGGSVEDLGTSSNFYSRLVERGVPPSQAQSIVQNTPTYWGDQPILEAPAYVGVTIFFLALLGFFFLKEPLRNALLLGSLLSLLLSWGKNFPWLTDFFIDFVPFYNKFRAVSSIQIILEMCLPIMATMAVHYFIQNTPRDWKRTMKVALIPVGGLILVYLCQGMLSFSGPNDAYYSEVFGADLFQEIVSARKDIFQADLFRALIFMALISGILLAYSLNKLKKTTALIGIAALVLFDLLGVAHRYIDNDRFESPRLAQQAFAMTPADRAILQDNSYYRVYEPKIGMNGARTAYFHNTLGGYHGAKPRRLEELFDYYKTHEISGILDMLNVKYVLYTNEEEQLEPLRNPYALGNAWLVQEIKSFETPDALLRGMLANDFEATALLLDDAIATDFPRVFETDSTAQIQLEEHRPGYLKFSFTSEKEQFAVFSEMYYPKGWSMTIDGETNSIHNVNYVLRGALIPAGKHQIEMQFDPQVIKAGFYIQWGTLLLFLIILGVLYRISGNSTKTD